MKGNLVISRRAGERFFLGDDISITFLRFDGLNAYFGIEAPRDVKVLREELKSESVRDAVKRRLGLE